MFWLNRKTIFFWKAIYEQIISNLKTSFWLSWRFCLVVLRSLDDKKDWGRSYCKFSESNLFNHQFWRFFLLWFNGDKEADQIIRFQFIKTATKILLYSKNKKTVFGNKKTQHYVEKFALSVLRSVYFKYYWKIMVM